MHAATMPRTSSSVSGCSTTNGYSTRQSVASVTCDTRCEAVERDVVLARMAAERTLHALSQRCRVRKPFREAIDGRARGVEQLADLRVAIGVERRVVARGACRSRSADGGARRRAACGAADCRAGRPADTDCARRPRCRRAPRTASVPSGRCAARRATPRAAPTSARRAAGSRSRDRRTTCSCTGFRAGGTFPCANPASRQPVRRAHSSERTMIPQRALRSGERTRDVNGLGVQGRSSSVIEDRRCITTRRPTLRYGYSCLHDEAASSFRVLPATPGDARPRGSLRGRRCRLRPQRVFDGAAVVASVGRNRGIQPRNSTSAFSTKRGWESRPT